MKPKIILFYHMTISDVHDVFTFFGCWSIHDSRLWKFFYAQQTYLNFSALTANPDDQDDQDYRNDQDDHDG